MKLTFRRIFIPAWLIILFLISPSAWGRRPTSQTEFWGPFILWTGIIVLVIHWLVVRYKKWRVRSLVELDQRMDETREKLNKELSSIEPIQRQLADVSLGDLIADFEFYHDWHEVKDPEKSVFDSGLSKQADERIFHRVLRLPEPLGDPGLQVMCGLVFGKVYKISVISPAPEIEAHFNLCREKHGPPTEFQPGCFSWEDDNTCLEFFVRDPEANVVLTDKKLLQKAYGG